MYKNNALRTLLTIILLTSTTSYAKADDNAILSIDYNYSIWKPTGIEGVDYETQGLNALEISLDLEPLAKRLARDMSVPTQFFVPTIKYLFTPENRVEQQELLENTTTSEGEEALEHLWIDLPIAYIKMAENKVAGLKFKYEKAAFLSKLTLNEDKEYRPFNEGADTLTSGDVLVQRTDFEKFTAMLEFIEDDNTTIGFGFYAQRYRKPYSATIDGVAVTNVIMDSKFSSKGFVVLLSKHTNNNSNNGIYFGGRLQMHYGEGEIEFSDDEGIDDYLSPYETTALILINAELETRIAFSKNFNLRATVGYDYYDFHKAQKTENGISSEKYMNDLDMNIDEMLYLKAGLVYNF